MKKNIALAIVAVIFVSLSAATNYQMKEYPFYGTIQINLFQISDNEGNSSIAGIYPALKLGYNLSSHFALELEGGLGFTKQSDPEASGIMALTTSNEDFESTTTIYGADMGIRYSLFAKTTFSPYITAGAGEMFWSVENDSLDNSAYKYDDSGENFYAYAGLGFENKVTDRFSINVDYKYKFLMGNALGILGNSIDADDISQIGLGFCFKFGRGVYEKVDLTGIEAIHFEFNSIRLTSNSKKILKKVAEAMKKNPDLVLEVRGYTDNTGSETVNRRMSKKRAITVKQMLVDLGIQSHRLITTGMGHNDPVATNATPEGRAMNRRVEFYELEK